MSSLKQRQYNNNKRLEIHQKLLTLRQKIVENRKSKLLAVPKVKESLAKLPKKCHKIKVCPSTACQDSANKCLRSISRDVRATAALVCETRNRILKELNEIEDSLHCLTGNEIRAVDVGTTGLIIDKPGLWHFCENIQTPGIVNQGPAIIIAANDVVLDLGGFVLQLLNPTSANVGDGIDIAPGVQNVTIRNGTLRGWNFSINILGENDLVIIEKLKIIEFGVDESFNANNVTVIGIQAVNMSNLIISNNIFDNGSGVVIALFAIDGLLIENNIISNIVGNTPIPGIGFVVLEAIDISDIANPTSQNITIRNNIIENLSSIATSANSFATLQAISLSTVVPDIFQQNIIIESNIIQQLTASADLGVDVEAIFVAGAFVPEIPPISELLSGPHGVVCQNNVVQGISITGSAQPNAGFEILAIQIEAQHVALEKNIVHNLVYNGPDTVDPSTFVGIFGLFSRGGQGYISKNNIVENINASVITSATFDSINIAGYQSCVCGIDGALIEGNYIVNIVSPSVPLISTSSFLAGFNLVTRTSELQNNVSNNNPNGFIFQNISPEFGLPPAHNIINTNTAIGNLNIGFWNIDPDNTILNAFYNNYARSNPGGNFVGLTGSPIVTWTLPALPPPNVDKLANVNILP